MVYGFDFTNDICYISSYDGDKIDERAMVPCPTGLEERAAFIKQYIKDGDRGAAVIEEVTKEIEAFAKTLGPDIAVVSKEEAAGHFILGEAGNAWKRPNVIFEFHSGYFCFYEMKRIGNIILIAKNQQDMSNVRIRDDKDKDKFFTKQSADELNVRQVLNVYLNGEEFDTEWMKLSLPPLCQGRRVFIGNHLFATGALRSLLPGRNEKVNLMTEDYHPYYWGIRAFHHGRKDVFVPIIQSGNFWFLTEGSVTVLMDECEELEIEGINSVTGETIRLELPLHMKAEHPMRTTKIKIAIQCTGIQTIEVTVEDMGFGRTRAGKGILYQEEYKLPSLIGR